MKKILRFFLILFVLLTSASCNKNSKFILKGDMSNTTTIEIDNYELENKINSKECFVLAILLNNCSTCEKFKNDILNVYIKETYAIVYSIDLTYLESYKNYDNKPYVKVAPTLVIYNEGKIVSTLNYDLEKKEFSNVENFKEYMEKFTIKPAVVVLNESVLDKKISEEETFILYIGWNKCGDCKLFEDRILSEYLLANYNDNTIYYLESDSYRSVKPKEYPLITNYENESEYEIALENWNNWIKFATKYNFVEYNDGKIPTIQFYTGGKVVDMIVYHNDKIENGIVIDSFFKECIGKDMSEDELLNYHDKKAIEFLNKYYKKN